MCCCIALHMSTAGQLYARRLLVYQPHMPLPRCCLMMRGSLPYHGMTSWEEAEEAAIAVDTFLHAIITFRNHCVEQFGG